MSRDTNYDLYKKEKSSILKPVRRFAEYVMFSLLQSIVSMLPIHWNQKIGSALGHLALGFAKKDRGIAKYQLDFCFPKLAEEERQEILVKNFRNVGMTLFETLAIKRFKQKPEKWIKLENQQIIHEQLKQGNGLILLCAHAGNWELYSAIFEMLGVNGITIISALGDQKLDHMLLKLRDSKYLRTIHRGDKKSAKEILKCLRNNEVMLLAIDQDTRVKTVFVDFFGRPAATASGAATFAQKFDTPVLSGFGRRLDDGTHHFKFDLLSAQPYQKTTEEIVQLTQKYTKSLEGFIKEYPDQWVWFHRRWKNQPNNGLHEN